jgi:hypothetical protein
MTGRKFEINGVMGPLKGAIGAAADPGACHGGHDYG